MPSNMHFDPSDSRGFQKSKMQSAKVLAARTNPLWYALAGALALAALAWGAWSWAASPASPYSAGRPLGARSMRAAVVGGVGGPTAGPSAAAQPPPPPPPPAPAAPAAPPAAAAAAAPSAAAAPAPEDARKRLIVLYTADGRINTGVWPSWCGDPPESATLNWGSAGVVVHKACPVPCTVTHDNSLIAQADAVLVEALNWPKFGLSGELPLPARARDNPRGGASPQLPLLGLFGYEPKDYFPAYSLANPALAASFDFAMTYDAATTLPISLVCPWGRPVAHFLAPPPPKAEGRLLAYFSEHGAAPAMGEFLGQLFEAAGARLHAYVHRRNTPLPPEAEGEPYALENRLAFLGTYKFLFITEQVEEADFLSNEWSQALQAGVVPVYLGIPNIAQYALPGGWVDARRFASGGALWEYLSSFEGEGEAAAEAYARFFEWKAGARAAAEEDGEGVLGTGQGVAAGACVAEGVEAVRAWPLPPAPGGGAPPAEAQGPHLAKVAAAAWRCFRQHLDTCVHFSECRMCRWVHERT
jgi:hypothetical protein